MTDFQAGGRVAMAAKLIGDTLKTEGNGAKAGLLADMVAAGVERLGVKDDDGASLGSVTLCGDGKTAKVANETAFTAWVKKAYPTEIVETVRPAFAKKLLDGATAAGMPVDAEGTVMPGVEMVDGEPYLRCSPTAEAKLRMQETLAGSGLLALTRGKTAEDGAQ